MTPEKWIGVHTGASHYLDHLGVLCRGLQIPLIVTEYQTYRAARTFYPGLEVKYLDISELTIDFLVDQADVIFESGHHFALDLIPVIELMYRKKMRVIYCPHGNSDKIEISRKDISLVYGAHMYRHLKAHGELERLETTVVTGNYRLFDYQKNRRAYDDALKPFLENKTSPHRKTIFYAPSWSGPKDRSFDLQPYIRILKEVGSLFNVLVRLHPFLDNFYPAECEQIRHCLSQVPYGVDLGPFPSIYPILQLSDAYLGDFSSIGYDFLVMDKPLFFIGGNGGKIYECGVTLQEKEHWGKIIENFKDREDFKRKRESLAREVFGKQKDFDIIRAEIKKALSCDRAFWIPS